MLPETGSLDVLAEDTAGVASEISLSSLASHFTVDECPLVSSIFWDG